MSPLRQVLLATSKSHAESLAYRIALHGDSDAGKAARAEAEQMFEVLADQCGALIAEQERERFRAWVALEREYLSKKWPNIYAMAS